jgi:outer membrane protein assembly factor BamA
LLAAYPLSKFSRLESSVVLRYAQDHLLRNGDVLNLWLLSNFLSYVHDDARYTFVGPAGGKRLNLTAGYTRDLSTGTGDSYTVEFDGRKYVGLAPDVVWATRLVSESVFGDDQQRFYLGGPFTVRGWDRRTIAGTKAAFVQTEVRFPILRRLRLGVPAPIEFPQLSVALFGDAAVAGGANQPLERIGGVGAGFYVGGGYFPALRVDVVRRTNLVRFEGRNVTRFMLGYNF